MTQAELEQFIESLENVQRSENFGYSFFFIGEDDMLPFTTIAHTDNEYETVSNLNRDGVFRINIGVSRKTFNDLFGDYTTDNIDYTVLNTLLPHPDYAKQNFICILNPSGENLEITRDLIREAHDLALKRYKRKTSS